MNGLEKKREQGDVERLLYEAFVQLRDRRVSDGTWREIIGVPEYFTTGELLECVGLPQTAENHDVVAKFLERLPERMVGGKVRVIT